MKILAVCGFGVGSSMVLKMTLSKAIKNLGIDATVDNTDVSSARGEQVDLVFTSEELADQLRSSMNCPVIAVNKYMDLDEVTEKLQEAIKL